MIPLCTLLVFLSVHEFGHIVAAWLSGGNVGEVALFSLRPHVQILGFPTDAQQAFRAAAGSVSSLLVCLGLLLLVPRTGVGWMLVRDTAAMFGSVELLGWTLSSLSPALHSASPDDAERFLTASGFDPHLVIGVCAAVAVAGALLFRRPMVRHDDSGIDVGATTPRTKTAAAGS